MKWYERGLDRVTDRFQLNASSWVPRLSGPGRTKGASPDEAGVFGCAYPIKPKEQIEAERGTGVTQLDLTQPSYYPIMNFYEMMSNWCSARRKARGKANWGGWTEFWSFLFEVSIGVYDTTTWGEPVKVTRDPDREPIE